MTPARILTTLTVLAAANLAVAARPNIVFIYTDDQAAWTLGCTGNKDVQTPVLDRFFAQSAVLRNCFATTPVCSPARASVMSSRYGTEVGILDWINPKTDREVGLDTRFVAWPKVLADSGYATTLFGKWHLGALDKYHPTRHGFQTFIGSLNSPDKVKDATFEIDGKNVTVPGLYSENVTRYAIEYLRKPHDKPFAMCVHYRNPHAPYIPVADDIWEHYRRLAPTLPIYPDLDTATAAEATRKYLASVAEIDRLVERILKTLDETQLAANTVVIFSSDQGYNIGHHGLWHKGNARWILNSTPKLPEIQRQRPNLFDTSLLVPTAIRWPGVIAPGSTLSETISSLDWYPTILAMAGTELPKDVEIHGHDFLPLLKGEHIAWNNDLYAEYSQRHYTTADLRTYRTPEWKLVRDFLNAGKDELYHLAKDPGETQNLINSSEPEVSAVISTLKEKLLRQMRAIHDPALKLQDSGTPQ